ncbi:MAG: hypothetical protein WAX44_00845 [Minisyncoccia bacterium]
MVRKFIFSHGYTSRIFFVVSLSWSIFPTILSAQTIQTFAQEFKDLVDILVPILGSVALLFFIWGVAQFVLNSGDSKSREEGKQRMLWGIIGMFIILSLFGIVAFLGNVFSIESCTNFETCFSPN